ncbi:MAG: hypothetical protein EP346_01050 [Bacteroidetes bacterium]|uniref:Uncharacterized protein n=1 Tax=Phaeocystidibacter marisrubri TaxID=1577780 RepID=A0A6L3ZHD9_9FLAO|nr:hypothetical protein [Phaeocystidibacter marisrubri]KAB2817247.1 hypothetical protein F8C82_02315 [Phaeocystidibacter marisrubri]TNE31422.1 MAG: hypothetical protein EP346_01050 [Bacteroidota bacterium]GGH76262.1 hypothetical protein GCM10011318_24260 [Phaeocystidibacter marisrubri]
MINATPDPNFKPSFKTLQIIHIALLMGQILFCFVAFLNVDKEGVMHFNSNLTSNVLYVVCITLVIVGNTANYFISNKFLNQVKNGNNLKTKFHQYQVSMIIRYAIIEGANLFTIVVFMLTGNTLMLYIAIAVIGIMGLLRPRRTHFTDLAELTSEEMREFESI